MATANKLITAINEHVSRMAEKGEKRLAAGKIDQAKFDSVMSQQREGAARTIAAIEELAEKEPDCIENLRDVDASIGEYDLICAKVDRYLGRA